MIIASKYKMFIGIDTGVSTGFAVWYKPRRHFKRVESLQIHQAMKAVQDLVMMLPNEVVVRVEDARLRKKVPYQKNEKAERGRAQGAGSIKRDASIWEAFLKDLKVDYEMVPPKNNKTKLDATKFQNLTDWWEPTNSHGRDAAMLVFGY